MKNPGHVVVFAGAFIFAGPAMGQNSGDRKGLQFEDRDVVVVAQAHAALGGTRLDIIRTLATHVVTPAHFTVGKDLVMGAALPADGKYYLMYFFRNGDEWYNPTARNFNGFLNFSFMPAQSPVGGIGNSFVEVAGLDDPRIAQTQRAIEADVAKSQTDKISSAKRDGDARLVQRLGEYYDFWHSHALVIAKTSHDPSAPFRTLAAQAQTFVVANGGVGPQLHLNCDGFFDGAIEELSKGRLALLCPETEGDHWKINGAAMPFLAGEWGEWTLNDNDDPQVDRIQRAIGNWHQRIIDYGGAKNPPKPPDGELVSKSKLVEPYFWDQHAVAVARVGEPAADKSDGHFHADLLSVISTREALPASLDVAGALPSTQE